MIKNQMKKPAFNDGHVRVYTVTDAGAPGRKPVESLALKTILRYEELRLGVYRHYVARQAQVEIARVIRCPRTSVSTQDIAVTEDGEQYRIDLVQVVPGVMPPAMDLSLVRNEQKREVVL